MSARGFQAAALARAIVRRVVTRRADRTAAGARPEQAEADPLQKKVALETGWRAIWRPWILHRSRGVVIDVKTGARIGVRLEGLIERKHDRRSHAAGGGGVPERVAAMTDLKSLEARRLTLQEGEHHSIVIVPLRLQSLRRPRQRSAICDLLDHISDSDRQRVIIEVFGFETTTPAEEIIETQQMFKPFCRLVLARIALPSFAFNTLGAARLPAIGVSACAFRDGPSHLAAGLLAFGVAARSLAPFRLVADLKDESLLSICDLAGFTHASVRTGT